MLRILNLNDINITTYSLYLTVYLYTLKIARETSRLLAEH